MFGIFGFQRKPHLLATIRSMCGACHDRAAHDVCSVRTRLRLFFAPVLPLPTTYRMTCTTCGTSKTVSAEQADRLLASGPHLGDALVTASAERRSAA